MINSVYGVASVVLRGVEPLGVIDVMKGNGKECGSISRFMLDVASQRMRL